MVIDPANGTAQALGKRIAPWPYIDRYQYRAGSALSPQTVYEILTLADSGYLYRQADLLDEIRETDAHLHSVLSRREAAVAGAEWELRPPEGSGARGADVVQYCTAVLRAIEPSQDFGLGLSDTIAALQGALYHGRSVIEVLWSNDGTHPVALEFVHPRRLALATDWRLHLWDQAGESPDSAGTPGEGTSAFPGIPLAAFPAGKFIVHTPRVRGSYPQREGLGRTCVWYSCFKKWGIRDLMALAAWAGRGLRIGKFDTGTKGAKQGEEPARATPEDVAILKSALDAMSSTVSVVVPDTCDLEVIRAADDPRTHETIVRLCNTELSKCVLGSTLTTEVGTTGGNRALGEVHKDAEKILARMDAASIAATLRRDLLAPMVARAFGTYAPVPAFAFATDPEADLDAVAVRVERAVRAGVKLGQRSVRNLLQLPDPEPGDDILTPPEGPRGGTAAAT